MLREKLLKIVNVKKANYKNSEKMGARNLKTVKYGIIGAGFVANLHMTSLNHLRDHKVEVISVAETNMEKAKSFAKKYAIPQTHTNWREMIAIDELDVIDICTPTHMHSEMVKEIAKAGKHIICEKPLTGFFGKDLKEEMVGNISKEYMYNEIKKELKDLKETIEKYGVKFMYAEDWVYAPPYKKMVNLLKKSNGTIIDIRAEESHSGSHADHATKWKSSGGGSLLRLGAHPVGGAIHLKYLEGMNKYNKPIKPESVVAEVSHNSKISEIQNQQQGYLKGDWVDVEDWGIVVINFTDNSKAVVISSDGVLGGVRNEMSVYTTNSVVNIDMSQNNAVTAFTPDNKVFGNEYITEKIETKAGWTYPSPDEDWMRGYPQEMDNFMDCILEDKVPESGWYLAEETVKTIYAAYLSAEKGKRINIR